MLTAALVCVVRFETTAVRLVLLLPLVVLAAVRAPTMSSSTVPLARVPLLPLTVRLLLRLSMVVWVLPLLAASTPDRAASTAPYFSPGVRLSGV